MDVWVEKGIRVPHGSRVCAFHLRNKHRLTEEALDLIEPDHEFVEMDDAEITDWISSLRDMTRKNKENLRRSIDFDNEENVGPDDYVNLVGFPKSDFDYLVQKMGGHIHKSANRTPRNALGLFLMFLRHDISQVIIIHIPVCHVRCKTTMCFAECTKKIVWNQDTIVCE